MKNKVIPNKSNKLTKRHITNERARLAQSLCKVNDRLIAIGLGDIKDATPSMVAALKTIQNKLLSDITSEDLDAATESPRTRQEIVQNMATAMTDKGMIEEVIKNHPKEAKQCYEQLEKVFSKEGEVTDIRAANVN